MTSCYSLLEQYITGSDLSFELMLNELCLLLSLSLRHRTVLFDQKKSRGPHDAPKYTQKVC